MKQGIPDSLEYVRIANGKLQGEPGFFPGVDALDAGGLYRGLGCNYPKFFKMDPLCKWAWLGAEALLRSGAEGWRYDGLDRSRIAVAMTTTDGCLDVDKRYADTLDTVPSPALFVYTLPNIMLGEICIRHGFTGEQRCSVQESFDAEELLYQASDLLLNRGASHCLFGKVDAVNDYGDLCLFWANAQNIRTVTAAGLQSIYELA